MFSFLTRKNKKNNKPALRRNNRTSRRLVMTGTNSQANNFINQRMNLNGREIRRQARGLNQSVQKRIHQKLYNMGM